MIAGLDSSGREESPDTDLRQQGKRATRLVTPGDAKASRKVPQKTDRRERELL